MKSTHHALTHVSLNDAVVQRIQRGDANCEAMIARWVTLVRTNPVLLGELGLKVWFSRMREGAASFTFAVANEPFLRGCACWRSELSEACWHGAGKELATGDQAKFYGTVNVRSFPSPPS